MSARDTFDAVYQSYEVRGFDIKAIEIDTGLSGTTIRKYVKQIQEAKPVPVESLLDPEDFAILKDEEEEALLLLANTMGGQAGWRDWSPEDKARHLLSHPTISDSSWTTENRLKGETRDEFVIRVLGQ